MSKPKTNRYPENPHFPGTMAAAGWDFNESIRRLAAVTVDQARADFQKLAKKLGR